MLLPMPLYICLIVPKGSTIIHLIVHYMGMNSIKYLNQPKKELHDQCKSMIYTDARICWNDACLCVCLFSETIKKSLQASGRLDYPTHDTCNGIRTLKSVCLLEYAFVICNCPTLSRKTAIDIIIRQICQTRTSKHWLFQCLPR